MNGLTDKIGLWFDGAKRDLPWRHTRDAYLIWLSEVILQQTRVAQGLSYYERFVQAFPTVEALATASEEEVLKLWQGLGYYSRARHLHAAAQEVVAKGERMEGRVVFPSSYDALLGLSGVGAYTASAVASFAGGEYVAVVDGNVYRVLSRLFDLDTPIDTPKGKRLFQETADALMAELPATASSARHNQALMELGALVCLPQHPRCEECPVADHCLALAHHTIGERPQKARTQHVQARYLSYVVYLWGDKVCVHKRGAGDIWQGLWEYVVVRDARTPPTGALPLFSLKHVLTHQTLYADFSLVARQADEACPWPAAEGCEWVTWEEWLALAMPRLMERATARVAKWRENALLRSR